MFCLRTGRVIAQRGAAEELYDEPVPSVASGAVHAFYEGHRWRGRADILGESLVWIGHLESVEFQRLNCMKINMSKLNPIAAANGTMTQLGAHCGRIPTMVLVLPSARFEKSNKIAINLFALLHLGKRS
jgi:hypothetical protein